MAKTPAECDSFLATYDAHFAALFDGDPAGAGTEITTNGVARQAVTFGAPTNAPGGGRQRVNSNVLNFGPISGTVNATHYGLFTAVSGGTMRRYAPLNATQNTNSGRIEVAISALVIKEQ
jgi:hypothetical protein